MQKSLMIPLCGSGKTTLENVESYPALLTICVSNVWLPQFTGNTIPRASKELGIKAP